jgi:hypothetical protein
MFFPNKNLKINNDLCCLKPEKKQGRENSGGLVFYF